MYRVRYLSMFAVYRSAKIIPTDKLYIIYACILLLHRYISKYNISTLTYKYSSHIYFYHSIIIYTILCTESTTRVTKGSHNNRAYTEFKISSYKDGWDYTRCL